MLWIMLRAVFFSLRGFAIALATVAAASTAAGQHDPPEWTAAFVQEALADARTHGDARRGAGVFSVATTGCTACHKVAGKGARSAPNSPRSPSAFPPRRSSRASTGPRGP